MNYEQARKDHTYLWEEYGPAADMTGGYVDQDDLERLLDKPTKATAMHCFINQIIYFLQVGPEDSSDELKSDGRILEIADRYGVDHSEIY